MHFNAWAYITTDGQNYVEGYGPINVRATSIFSAVESFVEKSGKTNPQSVSINLADNSAVIETASNLRFTMERDIEGEKEAARRSEQRSRSRQNGSEGSGGDQMALDGLTPAASAPETEDTFESELASDAPAPSTGRGRRNG